MAVSYYLANSAKTCVVSPVPFFPLHPVNDAGRSDCGKVASMITGFQGEADW